MPRSEHSLHPALHDPPLYDGRKRVAFTGMPRAIGRVILLRLAADGLNVAVNDKDVPLSLTILGTESKTLEPNALLSWAMSVMKA